MPEIKPNLVIYHGHCADGMGAAFAAYMKLGDTAEYVMGLYDAKFPELDLFRLRTVYIVDFSYSAAQIREIAKVATKVIILDHHKTAMQELVGPEFPINVTVVFDMERSGAAITWDYFFPDGVEPTPEKRDHWSNRIVGTRPKLIEYIQDRDLWTWKLPQSHEINAYISLFDLKLQAFDGLAEKLEDDFRHGLGECQAHGHWLLKQQEKIVGKICALAFERRIPGKTHQRNVMFINTSMMISEVGNELLKRHPHIDFVAGWFDKDESTRVWSLRANKGGFDVSALAKVYGGGGHPAAAGFTTSTKFMLESAT